MNNKIVTIVMIIIITIMIIVFKELSNHTSTSASMQEICLRQ